MSETLVEDGSAFPSTVTVPEDGDARNAASVVVGFQSLANRTRHLYTKLTAWITGGTITPGGAITVALDTGKLLFTSTASPYPQEVELGSNTVLRTNGRAVGQLVAAGRDGRVPRKPAYVTVGGAQSFDPTLTDYILCTHSDANATITLFEANLLDGDPVEIVSHSLTHTTIIKNGGGSTIATINAIGLGHWRAVWHASSSSWKISSAVLTA
jgi:hypothetical protein